MGCHRLRAEWPGSEWPAKTPRVGFPLNHQRPPPPFQFTIPWVPQNATTPNPPQIVCILSVIFTPILTPFYPVRTRTTRSSKGRVCSNALEKSLCEHNLIFVGCLFAAPDRSEREYTTSHLAAPCSGVVRCADTRGWELPFSGAF